MLAKGDTPPFMSDVVSASERSAPVVTAIDGHPHGLAWIGTALNTRTMPLGVSEFGQSGSRADLYMGVFLALLAFNLAGLFEDHRTLAPVVGPV